jgi:hypothetical protein
LNKKSIVPYEKSAASRAKLTEGVWSPLVKGVVTIASSLAFCMLLVNMSPITSVKLETNSPPPLMAV